jgi:ATP-binding cassette subfamily B protein
MATTEHSDPPAGVHSLWRLRSYLRPHAVSLGILAAAAIGGVGLKIAIPLVT